MCSAKLMALKKSGRQDVPCTPVCAGHPGLLGAVLPRTVGTGCIVRADLGSKMAFGAPTWPPNSQNDLQLALQLPFLSAPRH